MDKNEVLEKLEVLGFDIEEVPDFGYVFKYEGLTLLFMPDDDEDFLRFAAPNMFDVTDENRAFVLEVVNETNLTIKYSKVCVYGEQVWAFYEYCLFGGDLEDIIEHSLYLIRATVALFHRKVEGGDIEEKENDEEEKGEES